MPVVFLVASIPARPAVLTAAVRKTILRLIAVADVMDGACSFMGTFLPWR
jgi:hypothetical protein